MSEAKATDLCLGTAALSIADAGTRQPRCFTRVDQTVGNTPLVRLQRLTGSTDAAVWCKLEGFNPSGSVKDRIAVSMIDDAEQRGLLKPGGGVVEATSGNTGIGLAMVCAARGYSLYIVMPPIMSEERKRVLRLRGATLVQPELPGMKGSMKKAVELKESKNLFYIDQFSNGANPRAHVEHTGPEIVRAFAQRDEFVDFFVAGVGTGGTITGCSAVLKAAFPNVMVTAVEPAGSPVLSGGQPGPHALQGIGAGFKPQVLSLSNVDGIETVTDEDARAMQRELTLKEGIFTGFSGGAAMVAALRIARGKPGKNVVVILPDGGDRYLSMLDVPTG